MKKILFILILCASFSGCTKTYPDGGKYLSIEKMEKMFTGCYVVELLMLDNFDITQQYKDSCNCNIRVLENKSFDLINCRTTHGFYNGTIYGSYLFYKNREKISIIFNNRPNQEDTVRGFCALGSDTVSYRKDPWEILKFENDEIIIRKLRTECGDGWFVLKMKKI